MQGRIKLGAPVFQDRRFGKWPACCPPGCSKTGRYEADDPDMVFEVECMGHYWVCKADGFGMLRSRGEVGEYGNGSIFVRDPNGVELTAQHSNSQKETVETEPTREERIKIATSCLDSQRAKDLFAGLAAIFTDAGVFWDVDEGSAGLEDEDILITIQS